MTLMGIHLAALRPRFSNHVTSVKPSPIELSLNVPDINPLGYRLDIVPGTDPAFVAEVQQAMKQILDEDPLYRQVLEKHPLTLRLCKGSRQFFKGIRRLETLFTPEFIQKTLLPRLRSKMGTAFSLAEEKHWMLKILRYVSSGAYAFYLDGSPYLMIHDLQNTDRAGQVKPVLRHELSHFVDYWGGRSKDAALPLSQDPACLEAIGRDSAQLAQWVYSTPTGRQKVRWPDWVPPADQRLLSLNFVLDTLHDETGVAREVFAETLASVRGGGACSTPQVIRRMFPVTTAWLEAHLLPRLVPR